MKNKVIILSVLILLAIIIPIIIFRLNNSKGNNDNNTFQNAENIVNNNETNLENLIKESEEVMENTIIVTIDNENYNMVLEQNETAKQFQEILPQKFNMNELNGNEKCVYLDTTLSTNSYNPKHIEAGDVMLFGNDCLVVFYKSFDTTYNYTKIGHIENLKDLGKSNITAEFRK